MEKEIFKGSSSDYVCGNEFMAVMKRVEGVHNWSISLPLVNGQERGSLSFYRVEPEDVVVRFRQIRYKGYLYDVSVILFGNEQEIENVEKRINDGVEQIKNYKRVLSESGTSLVDLFT